MFAKRFINLRQQKALEAWKLEQAKIDAELREREKEREQQRKRDELRRKREAFQAPRLQPKPPPTDAVFSDPHQVLVCIPFLCAATNVESLFRFDHAAIDLMRTYGDDREWTVRVVKNGGVYHARRTFKALRDIAAKLGAEGQALWAGLSARFG